MNNIRKARDAKGLTGEKLGELVGVQKSAISKYERDEIQPSKDILFKLADVLSCSIDYLLGREAPEESKKAHSEAEQAGAEIEEGFYIVTAMHRDGAPVTYKIPIEKAKPVLEIMKSLEDVDPPDYL